MIAIWLVTATRGDREAKRIEEPQRQPARQRMLDMVGLVY